MKTMLLLIICLAMPACGTKRPVLYPNTHLRAVGTAQGQRDIEACRRQADDYLDKSPRDEVVEGAVRDGAVGAAAGAAAGAVYGRPGRGAAAGGAGGAAAGFMRGILRNRGPGEAYKNFVEKCLRDKGYEPIGWQ